MTKKIKESWDKLFDLYYAGKLDEQTKEIVQGWLLSDENREVKDANIFMLFEKILKQKRKPDDEYVRQSLAAIQEELGFTDRTSGQKTVPLTRRKSFKFLIGGSIVAAAAVLIGVFVLPNLGTTPGQLQPTTTAAEVTILSDSVSAKDIMLPDGSMVRLKGSTTLAYADDFENNRKVRIDGEAFFTVVKDEGHPFTVESDDLLVTVLGTEFNVKAYNLDETAEIALASGKVQINSGSVSISLNPNEKAVVDKYTHLIELNKIGEAELLRLRGINLSFNDTTLDDAFKLIGEFFNVRMKVATGIGHVDGIVLKLDDNATLDETLFFLQATTPVFEYQIEGNEVTITEK